MVLFGMQLYQIAWYFVIYSFAGWVIEVVYHAVTLGKVINRGFLNGPVCPVYGFGVLSVFIMISIAGGNENSAIESIPVWQLFIGGVILSTAIELIAGWLLDVLFHARWWDYSHKPFNLNGYICLEFSLIWGLAIAFVVREIQPAIRNISGEMIPERYGWPILFSIYCVYLIDLIVTVLTVIHLNRKLEELDRLSKKLRTISDEMSRAIGGGTVKTMAGIEQSKVRIESAREEFRSAVGETGETIHSTVVDTRNRLNRKKERFVESITVYQNELQRHREELYSMLRKQKYFGAGRILRAFPGMRHTRFNEPLSWIQNRLKHEDN